MALSFLKLISMRDVLSSEPAGQKASPLLTPLYVIGYPKSGNTWLTRLLADTCDSEIYYTNQIDGADRYEIRKGKYLVIKNHFSGTKKPKEIETGSIFVYVVRDFRDVLISSFFYGNKKIDQQKVMLLDKAGKPNNGLYRRYFRYYTKRMIKKWQSSEYEALLNCLCLRSKYSKFSDLVGNWSDHVNSWLAFPNIVCVRYEDLLDNPLTTMTNLLEELKISFSQKRLVNAVEQQSFERRKGAFAELKDETNFCFLRKGISGDWKNFLDDELLKEVDREHGEVMERMGYLTKSF